METLDYIRNGGETRRYHTWPVLRTQTVAEHSFHVAMLYSLMAGAHEPTPDEPVSLGAAGLMAALTHDLAEWEMGDLPAPIKRQLPDYNGRTFREIWGGMEEDRLQAKGLDWAHALHPLELRWLKLADAMDGCLYCVRERAMGNKLITTPFINFRRYVRELFGDEEPSSVETEIVNYIDDMWEQVNGGE
jgi:5'-deoxynucleotidase YfbR-like HD superfamily hydrolase